MINYKTRTPEDICLLCRRNNDDVKALSTATNSHFTPMGMIQSNTGRRNYETTISINLANGEEHEVYYGRSNLKNTDPEIGNDPHTADNIFCQECEDKLAEVENSIIEILNKKLRDKNQKQNFPSTDLTNNVSYKECLRINPSEFKLFVYSIIWRQNLQQQLNFDGEGIFSEKTESKLRKAVLSGLYEGVEENKYIINCFPFSIITAEGFENATKHQQFSLWPKLGESDTYRQY